MERCAVHLLENKHPILTQFYFADRVNFSIFFSLTASYLISQFKIDTSPEKRFLANWNVVLKKKVLTNDRAAHPITLVTAFKISLTTLLNVLQNIYHLISLWIESFLSPLSWKSLWNCLCPVSRVVKFNSFSLMILDNIIQPWIYQIK